MNSILASIIRTVVPVAVGQVVAWLALLNVELTDDAQTGLTAFLGGLITAVYYVLVRLAEQKLPWVGVLLGLAKTPDGYSKPEGKHALGPDDLPDDMDTIVETGPLPSQTGDGHNPNRAAE